MAGLRFIASSRPTQDIDGDGKLTFALPDEAIKGDLLALLVLRAPAAAAPANPADWTVGLNIGGGTTQLQTWLRLVDDNEPATIELADCDPAFEWHGQLVVLRGGRPQISSEASANAAFAADATPGTPAALCQQAIDVVLCAWQATTAVDLDPPAGFTAIDDYSTALVAARTSLFAYRVANASGTVAPGDATSAPGSTGRAFTWILRDDRPRKPAELADVIPGHIGLVGKDHRRVST